MHLEDEQAQRLLHGELDPPAKQALTRHLAGCAECTLSLDQARREEARILDLLRQVDHVAPAVDVNTLMAQTPDRASRWRWAAGVFLALGAAGVAYAAPGSPLPGWVKRVAERLAGQAPTPSQAAPPVATQPFTAGIAVTPGQRFLISFAAEQNAGTVTVSLTNGSDIVARAMHGTATFTSEADGLAIDNRGSAADYEIELPRDAPWVEIRVGERRLILKRGDHLVGGTAADARGRYVLPLGPARP